MCQQVKDTQGPADEVYGPDSFAQQLIRAGSSPDAVEPESGQCSVDPLSSITHSEISKLLTMKV